MKAALIWNSPALPGRQLRITRPHLYWLAALMAGALAATLWIALTALEFVQQGNGALDTHMAAGGLLLLALGLFFGFLLSHRSVGPKGQGCKTAIAHG